MLNRGKRALAASVLLFCVIAAEASGAAVRAPSGNEPADGVETRITNRDRDMLSKVRGFVARIFAELTIPIPAPKP